MTLLLMTILIMTILIMTLLIMTCLGGVSLHKQSTVSWFVKLMRLKDKEMFSKTH